MSKCDDQALLDSITPRELNDAVTEAARLRAFAAAHYGTVTTVDLDDDDLPALSPEVAAVVEAAKEWRTASIEWDKAARRGEVLGIAADHRANAVNALIAAVDALLAAERASTEEDR